MSTRDVPADLVEQYELIRQAIANRHQLVLTYAGLRREVCPHSLGWKDDTLACLAWQFGGASSQGLPPRGQWRCLHLESMSEVTARPGEWHTGPVDPHASSCIDDYVAYVGFPIGAGGAFLGTGGSIDALVAQRIEEALEPLVRRIEDLEWQLQARDGEGE